MPESTKEPTGSAEARRDVDTPIDLVPSDQLVNAVAARMRTRGVVLDEHEFTTVAMALDCPASELATAYEDTGSLIWDDENDTVELRRLPWMTDTQWHYIRDRWVDYCLSVGLERVSR